MSLGWAAIASDVGGAVGRAGGRDSTKCFELGPAVLLGTFSRLLLTSGSVPCNRAS